MNFGLKPTLRVVQKLIRRGGPKESVAYAFAEKQLYSSHYFETALDLSFCIRDDANGPGFYLIMLMGSEQAGLTGVRDRLSERQLSAGLFRIFETLLQPSRAIWNVTSADSAP